MDRSVIIKSTHDGTTLEFSEYSGDYYDVALRGPGFRGAGPVYADDPAHLASFFRDLATHWQGWAGEKKWGSLDDELCLAATSDSIGHTELEVQLTAGSPPFHWTLRAALLIEAGQLESIAKRMEEFLSGV